MTIRMTSELRELLERTAAHIDCDLSYIARATCRWLARHGVIQMEKEECITSGSGNTYLCIRGVELPDGVSVQQFREALYVRCSEALAKPGVKKFEPAAVAGRDYVVVSLES